MLDINIDDVVVVLVKSFGGDLKVGVVSDELSDGRVRVHFGNVYTYFTRDEVRLATDSEAMLAKPVSHPSRRLGVFS